MNSKNFAQINTFELISQPALLEAASNTIGEEIIAIAKTKQPKLKAAVKYTVGPWPTMVGFDAAENTGILPIWELSDDTETLE